MTMLTRGADRLLELHAAELPQKDELCGCFWATLALRLHGEGPVEQDDVALIAGSVITSHGSRRRAAVRPAGPRRLPRSSCPSPTTTPRPAPRRTAWRSRSASSTDGRLAALPVTGLDASGVRALLRAAAEGTAPGRPDRERPDRRVLGLAPDRRAARGLSRARRPRRRARRRLVGRALRRPGGPERGPRRRARRPSPTRIRCSASAACTCSRSRRVAAALGRRGALVVAEPDVAAARGRGRGGPASCGAAAHAAGPARARRTWACSSSAELLRGARAGSPAGRRAERHARPASRVPPLRAHPPRAPARRPRRSAARSRSSRP